MSKAKVGMAKRSPVQNQGSSAKKRKTAEETEDNDDDRKPAAVSSEASDNAPKQAQASTTVKAELGDIQKLIMEDLSSNDANIVKKTLTELANSCLNNEKGSDTNRKAIFNAGGHALIVLAMKKWHDNFLIQAEACRALQNISCFVSHETVVVPIVSIGGIEAVLSSMKTFPDVQSVQRSGCGALIVFICNKEDSAKHLVLKLGELSTVINAMKAFPNNVDIQKCVCMMLYEISRWSETKTGIGKAGGIVAIASAIENHPDSDDVQKCARKAMQNLFSTD